MATEILGFRRGAIIADQRSMAKGLSRTEYYDDEEEGEEQNDRERRLRERERKVEEREKRMDEIEARLKRLEENGCTTAPSA